MSSKPINVSHAEMTPEDASQTAKKPADDAGVMAAPSEKAEARRRAKLEKLAAKQAKHSQPLFIN